MSASMLAALCLCSAVGCEGRIEGRRAPELQSTSGDPAVPPIQDPAGVSAPFPSAPVPADGPVVTAPASPPSALILLGGSAHFDDATAYPRYLPAPRPRARPSSGIVLQPGADIQAAVNAHPAGTPFLLAAGTWHAQHVTPRAGDEFWGVSASDTVLDGDGTQGAAFTGSSAGNADVTIANMRITNYTVPVQYAVVDSNLNWLPWGGTPEPSPGWRIYNNDISGNHDGAGVTVGSRSIVRDNRIYDNGQLGLGGGGFGSVLSYNDIGWNNTDHYDLQGWGSGGVKMCVLDGDHVFEHNYVHDTRNGGKGVWWDVSDVKAHIRDNIVVNNAGAGIFSETAKDGCTITGNLTVHNGWSFVDWKGWGAGIVLSTSLHVGVSSNISFDNVGPQLSVITQDRPDGPGGGNTLTDNVLGPGNQGFTPIVIDGAGQEPDTFLRNVTVALDALAVPRIAVGPQGDGY